METSVSGVSVSPAFVEFLDVKAGETYRANVTVKNVGKSSKSIRLYGPSSLFLQFAPSCYLEIQPEVDFGTVIANSKVIYKEIEIKNHGSAPGAFKIKYKGNLPVNIMPSNGIVQPKTSQLVKVELCTTISKIISEVAEVKLQGCDDTVLSIEANVVKQMLELRDPYQKKLECIRFGSAYFGTTKVEQAVLCNNSPEAINWIAVLEDDAIGGEMGVDLEKCTDVALIDMELGIHEKCSDVTTIISCIPNQGVLEPFQQTSISLCFTPKDCRQQMVLVMDNEVHPRQDYALFMRFEIVGSKDNFLLDCMPGSCGKGKDQRFAELALTGTGFPVQLTFSTGLNYSFSECLPGEHTVTPCILKNENQVLPVTFSFCKTAHFNISPSKGKIEPGFSQNLVISFVPHQVGTFKVKQEVSITGPVLLENEPGNLKTQPFHQIYLNFIGICKPTAKKIEPKINPGITPVGCNEIGQLVNVTAEEIDRYSGSAKVAFLNAANSSIHSHKRRRRNLEKNALVAFPNDRAASIKPTERHKNYMTIFTKTERYSYVDPEYAYTDEQQSQRITHKQYYRNFINSLREHRMEKQKAREFENLNNPIDIGIKPAAGLKPQVISVNKMEKMEGKNLFISKGRLLTTRELAAREITSSDRPATDGLNAVPYTDQEKEDCCLTLTPMQLHEIVIGPSTVDFGEVCIHSSSTRPLNIINNLPQHIWIQIDIESLELQQTSPLSHVVPPLSRAHLPLVFETDVLGKFQKSVTYTINGKHTGHVLVLAKAIPIALELSTHELILTPMYGALANSGFRGSIRLSNHRNHPAEFTWKPVITEKGIAFSMRPARGIVDAFSDLECEVVWHPSFFSPEEGEFDLHVHQGNTVQLKCIAKVPPCNVQFLEQRVFFAAAPLNLLTVKTAILRNNGQNHAYFQVSDVCPLPGMTIVPTQGVVPVGGQTELKIYFTPNAVMKFDTQVEVKVRNTKSLELRIGGTVKPPEVDISVKCFKFHGVYIGSIHEIPFMLENKGVTRARVEFDLSKFTDFGLKFKDNAGVKQDSSSLYSVELEEKETLECALVFSPKEVAAYDFNIPVNVNNAGAPSPPPSSIPKTPSGSEKHIVAPRPQTVFVVTPSRRVQATGLRPPLLLSDSKMEFELHSGFIDFGIVSCNQAVKDVKLKNISKHDIAWKFDLSQAAKHLQSGMFKIGQQTGSLQPDQTTIVAFYFCPSQPGTYTAEVPLFLDNDSVNPYRLIYLTGTVKCPSISFKPPLVFLTPVPLDAEAKADVLVIPHDFSRDTTLQVEIPEVQLEDGSTIDPLSVQFLNGNVIAVSAEEQAGGITCCITFRSPKPLSFSGDIIFIDGNNNRYKLPFAATAENCILTVYPYLAAHHMDQQIVLKSGQIGQSDVETAGEAVLRPCYTPGVLSCTSSSSSTYEITNSSYEELIPDPDYTDGILNGKRNGSDSVSLGQGVKDKWGLLLFPDEDTEQGLFCQRVLTAVQKWFIQFGWPKGPHPFTVPQYLRRAVCKIQMSTPQTRKTSSYRYQLQKDTRTVYDMLLHLSGELLPGITASQALPSDPIERILQLHWQHATLLTFLKVQGASLAHVRPEFLLEPEDFKTWNTLQAQMKEMYPGRDADLSLMDIEDFAFESVSKRAWTDMLLQIYKVLVLSRIASDNNSCPADSSGLETIPKINPDPLSSNIYSTSERILLTWLNVHYEKKRKVIWEHSIKGGVPPMRWIINFDRDLLDGLVLATLLAAYCPFLIKTHLVNMYTNPVTPEQCLHNCLVLVNAFQAISLDIDVQATEVCDGNPVTMLILCVYLYEKLPQYHPKKTVEFVGALHATVLRQVSLKNNSSKPLEYSATLVGHDSEGFSLPRGNAVTVPPKSQTDVTLEFVSHFLYPAEASLLLVSRSTTGTIGTTIVFSLKSQINSIIPVNTSKCESPCYAFKKMQLAITNPFSRGGDFRIILVESKKNLYSTLRLKESGKSPLVSNTIKFSGNNKSEDKEEKSDLSSQQYSNLSEFFSPAQSLHLEAEGSSQLTIHYLPFHLGKRYCTIIFVNEQIGEFVCCIEGTGGLPLPLPLLPMESHNSQQTYIANRGDGKAHTVLRFKCENNSVLEEDLKVPLINEAREKALAIAAQQQMSFLEYRRRKLTGTLESSSIRAAVAALGLSGTETCQVISDLLDSEGKTSALSLLETSSQVAHHSIKCTYDVADVSSRTTAFGSVLSRYSWLQLHTLPDDIKAKLMDASIDYKPLFGTAAAAELFKSLQEKGKDLEDLKSIIVSPVLKFQRNYPNKPNLVCRQSHPALKENAVILPLKFIAKNPGCHQCQIVLLSAHDVRVYIIECVVNQNSAEATLQFVTPVHQAVTQEIPISNQTLEDWKLQAVLEGSCFYGPPFLHVKTGEVANYPLMFKPMFECVNMGQLTLKNETDGTEHIFALRGVGKKPMALDHIVIDSQVKQISHKVLMVPNYTQSKITCKVVSDLAIVGGAPTVTIKPGEITPYELNVSPWKRGKFSGVISFVAENVEQQLPLPLLCTSLQDKTDGASPKVYEVWYTLTINSLPNPPERLITVNCPVQKTVEVEIPISNPTHGNLDLSVLLEGAGLAGSDSLFLNQEETCSYMAIFSPSVTGRSAGRIIFQSNIVGEFWYQLELIAEEPLPTTLPEVQCELGKWTRLFILLDNPTDELLELETVNSNRGNFLLEIEPKQPVKVMPHSTTKVPVQFCPSALGRASHKSTVTFKCPQLNKWLFHLSGFGLIPQPMEPVSISTCIGSHCSVIVPFRNPTDKNVLVDILLTDQEQTMHRLSASVLRQSINKESAFCLPLKKMQGIALPPKGKLDIPVVFAPDTMKLYEALLVIHLMKEDKESWPYDDLNKQNSELKSVSFSEDGKIYGIRWIYPVHGIPEALPLKTTPTVICCRARNRIEERIEVLLTGAVPGPTATPLTRVQRASSANHCLISSVQDEVHVTEGLSTADEFNYQIQYESEQVKSQMESSIALNLVDKERDIHTGIVTLTFNIVYSPYKPFRCTAILVIQCATGGVWKFPIEFIATQPEIDDVINIEATGLNKESFVGFRLTSQTRSPTPFTAYFLPGSDPEFAVAPQTGELLPPDTAGTRITIGLKPKMYSKKYQAMLVIQTAETQWMYKINGMQPQSTPPTVRAGRIASVGYIQPAKVRQRNFIRENLKLITTAVSSPIKGTPLVIRTK
ncbi:cilia- and flagella-associated protein 47 [Protopterus annectens]|uniref:cilia- and flagella-associated protein 47 n=1 Tax=Protopterus annectens TaxID=7888 RepID=UPI001CF99B56|nr:cilia- and flagella-associated protein 47 [Protopterus annectens]